MATGRRLLPSWLGACHFDSEDRRPCPLSHWACELRRLGDVSIVRRGLLGSVQPLAQNSLRARPGWRWKQASGEPRARPTGGGSSRAVREPGATPIARPRQARPAQPTEPAYRGSVSEHHSESISEHHQRASASISEHQRASASIRGSIREHRRFRTLSLRCRRAKEVPLHVAQCHPAESHRVCVGFLFALFGSAKLWRVLPSQAASSPLFGATRMCRAGATSAGRARSPAKPRPAKSSQIHAAHPAAVEFAPSGARHERPRSEPQTKS